MLIISSREFRDNQKSYLDKIDNGEEVLLHRGKNKSYKIIPVVTDDTCMSKEEYHAMLDVSLQQAKEGKTTIVSSDAEIKELLGL